MNMLEANIERPTSNVQRRMQNITLTHAHAHALALAGNR
jgi:hypothetical protein